MACYHPITAYKCANGEVVFYEHQRYDIHSALSLPCGRCIGCRLERSRQWAVRCMHEAALHEANSFVTLTYDDDHLPVRGQLEYSQFQRFMRRLRKHCAPHQVRFFMCGEYGELNGRPHFHALLFNYDFPDQEYLKTENECKYYSSPTLSRLWPYGNSLIGALTFESAAYVARYTVKKVTGDLAAVHYRREDADGVYQLQPEFGHMSLKPGIGQGFLAKYRSDVYPHDFVVSRGFKAKPPRYYDKQLRRADPEALEQVKCAREVQGLTRWKDNTDRRLADREVVQTARAQFLRRNKC